MNGRCSMRNAKQDSSAQTPEVRSCNGSERAVALDAVVEKAAGPIFSLDRQYRYTGFNMAHVRMMKQLYDADIELGHSLNEYMLVPTDWQMAKNNLDRALQGEAFLETAYSGGGDRRRRYFAVVHNPIHDQAGAVVGVSVFVQDITERQQNQEAELRKSEQRFRTVAEFTYDWQYWMLPDGSLEYVSPSCEQISGYAAAEFRLNPQLLLDIIHPEDRELLRQNFLAARRETEDHWEEQDVRIIARSGEVRWISHACRPVFDPTGEYLGRRASLRDITHRKIREQELRTLQLAMENVAASIIITNREGNIEYVNAKFTEITGYTFAECVGRNPRFLKDPDKPSAAYRELWETITAGKSWRGIFKNVKKEGSFYWESAIISPVHDETGEIIRFVAVKEDITEHLKAEKELREREERFRRLVQKTPLAMALVNPTGDVGYINDRFTESFGYMQEDLPNIEYWWRNAYPDEKYRQIVRTKWEEAVAQSMKTGKDVEAGEYKITCKSGEERIVETSGIPMGENMLVAFNDVTERRRQERLLRASYERKKKNDLLNELILEKLPSKQTLKASARMLGMRVIEPFVCYVVMIDSYRGVPWKTWTDRRDEVQNLIDNLVDELSDESCVCWESAEGIGILHFDEMELLTGKDAQLQQGEKLRNVIARFAPELSVSIGIAERAATLTDIGGRYRQAGLAAATGRRIWSDGGRYHYLDMGIFQLLPYLKNQQQVDAYIERTLGKLLH
jgi:PAS domain S-box-containing protein